MKTPEHIVRLKKPHRKQADFLQSKAKRKIVRAGRRSGKTTAAAILGVQRFLAGGRVLVRGPCGGPTRILLARS